MTNQLLMAAARGARIQSYVPCRGWVWSYHCDLLDTGGHRIHPDDDHLRFGPISMALREDAVKASRDETLTLPVGNGAWWLNAFDYREYQDCHDELHRSLFLLILSEALAEEGL